MKLQTYKGIVGNSYRIYDCPEPLRTELTELLTFRNPDYDTVRRFSPWENTRVSETVCLVEDFYDYIEFPRGFTPEQLTPIARNQWNLIRWEDVRTKFNVKFPRFRLVLNEEQERVAKMFRQMEARHRRPSGSYLFVVPTSGGKTIAQAAVAAITGQRTLVLCKTNLIKKSWQENLYKLFGMNEEDLGEIQQKTFRLGEHITLASIATLSRRKHLWHEIFSQVGCLVIDECFPRSVKVDGKSIADIKPGDFVRSYDHATGAVVRRKVLATKRSTPKLLCRVELTNGAVIPCTPNHPFWSETRGSYVLAWQLTSEDRLLVHAKPIHSSMLETPLSPLRQTNDGYSGLQAVLEQQGKPKNPQASLLLEGVRSSLETQSSSSGKTTKQPLKLPNYSGKDFSNSPSDRSPSSRSGRQRVSVAFVGNPSSSRARNIVDAERGNSDSSRVPQHSKQLQSGLSSQSNQDCSGNRRGQSRCVESSARRHEKGDNFTEVGVARVALFSSSTSPEFLELCPEGEVFNLEVEGTNNYFADDVLVHNCQIIGAETIREICSACPARYIIGMTATETRRDDKTYLVRSHLGKHVLKIFNKQKETQSSLPLSDARLVRTSFRYLDDKEKPVPKDLLNFTELTQKMTEDPVRNNDIIREVYSDWEKGHSVLVVTPRVEHVQALVEALRKRGIDEVNALTGETNSKKFYTDKLLEAIMSRKCRCVVASTQAVKLGANLNPLDRLHAAIPPSNKEDLEQVIGRIRRKHPGKKDAVLVYYHDILVPYWHGKFKSVFVPTMRKLRLPRYLNLFVA